MSGDDIVTSALASAELGELVVKLRCGEYDGVDIMNAWIAIEELVSRREAMANACYVDGGYPVLDTERVSSSRIVENP